MNVKIFYKDDIPEGVSKVIVDGVECDWQELMEELYSDPVLDLFRLYIAPMGNAGGVEFALDYLPETVSDEDIQAAWDSLHKHTFDFIDLEVGL